MNYELMVAQIQYYLDQMIKVFIYLISDLVNKFKYSEDIKILYDVEYSPFVVNNIEVGCNSNIICPGSSDNKKELYLIKENGICCIEFISMKKKKMIKEKK
ncbi:hypothetical protein RFI_06551 [Reticulomyxa filosa]|uniref:Uncharacterized protein n=1 Tax=Reticulomyxa filosa TaxID=46433 RepID=X6NZ66_RETFI|nr:hypothetical protein RFI_06551 [Reticulomyxa filosa]|eukprot:ETO30572.1 hypothetical protein RFI_06551 [Reticulomyxa filosa]